MSDLINNREELISYLTTKQICSSHPPDNVMVSSKVRASILTSIHQDKLIHKGTSSRFAFKSLGGGVYLASIVPFRSKSSD